MAALPPADLLPITRDFLVEIGGWPVLKQAQALVDANRVLGVAYQAPVLSARIVVEDRELVTRLKMGRRLSEVENLCTCRQAKTDGSICPHVVAAGLKWLQVRAQSIAGPQTTQRANEAAATVAASSRTVVSAAVPKGAWRCLAGTTAPTQVRLLEVRALLPLSWPQVLATGAVRIILEGRVQGEAEFRPWDSISRGDSLQFAVSEEDESLLRWVEQRHDGKVPGIFEVGAVDLPRFLRGLIGHPRVWIGKKAPLHIHGVTQRPSLELEGRDNGELVLHFRDTTSRATPAFQLGTTLWNWIESERILEEAFSLPAPYAMLRQGPVAIPAAQVANFVERELPALSRLLRVESDGSFEKIQFDRPKPHICVTLEGGLPGMSARVEADYGSGGRFLLHPREVEPGAAAVESGWQADPKQPRRYWTRHRDAERVALREVTRVGFAAGHRSPENFFLSGERPVGDFLANVLPRWRQEWTVEFGPRMVNLLPRLDYVEPEITLHESGGGGGSGGNDWLSLDLQLRAPGSGETLSSADVQRWLQTGLSHQRTEGDRIRLIPTKGWSELQQVLVDCDIRQEPGRMRLDRKFAPYLEGAVQAQGWSLSAQSNWPPKRESGPALPSLREELNALLRPYQRQGVDWLSGLAQRNLCGLLADEMGLGKTIQMLALLDRLCRARRGDNAKSPALIICPTSLTENWRSEATRFTPNLRVLVLQGADRHADFAKITGHDLVITSYALLRRDLEQYLAHEFTAVILDEAQHIKNRGSLNAQSAKALKAKHRFVLTGTPLENSLFDLWSIVDFLMPGYLGTAKDFKERYEVPIAREKDAAVQERLRLRLRPIFLRRTKEEVVADLPAKLEQVTLCELTPEQQGVYQAILEQGRREVFDGSGKSGQGKNRMAVLTALLRLRQAACHLALLPEGDKKSGDWKEPSGKFDMSLELLDEAIDGGHRVLVFSQFVQLLHLFRAELEARKIDFCYLDGATVNRAEEVRRFQSNAEIPVFLISLKAGGVGLNLTGADTVLHLDPWWNPAVEDQATARAHRIGQTRVVSSYKLIARGTVEEKILALQDKKKELIAANMSNEAVFVESLSWEELEGLFK